MNDYINLVFEQLSSSIGYGLLGLGIGILIIFLLKKWGYLERNYLLLKIITKFYFVLFPVGFLLYFWFVGSLWTTKSLFQEAINEVIIQVQEESYPIFAANVNDQIKNYINLDQVPSNTEIVQIYLSENSFSQESKFYQATLRYTLVKILDLTIGNDTDREKRITALSNGISASAFEYGFDYLRSQIERQIRQTFIFSLIPGTIAFISIFFFPTIEIIISNRFLKRLLENDLQEND